MLGQRGAFKILYQTSGQDGGRGRHTVPPRNQKDNNKFKNKKINQNCQKIELYGSLTTKELEKKHLSRLVGEAEMGSWVEKTCSNAAAGELGWARWWLGVGAVPHRVQINWKGKQGTRQTTQPRVPAQGNKASKPQAVKTCGGCGSGRNSQPHRRAHWRDPQDPGRYTSPHTQGISTRSAQLVCGKWGRRLKASREPSKGHCSLSDPSSTYSTTT